MNESWEIITKACARLGIKPAERCLLVRISTQTLQFYKQGSLVHSYVISTSLRPPSNVKNSLGTPRGMHEIAERIGAGQPPGMVFKSRRPTGHHFSEIESANDNTATQSVANIAALVTTRILWLRGLEPGVNLGGDVDTYDRYVYIHGTNREDLIGQPQSAGCVVMRNLEIIELYDHVRVGDMVLIVD